MNMAEKYRVPKNPSMIRSVGLSCLKRKAMPEKYITKDTMIRFEFLMERAMKKQNNETTIQIPRIGTMFFGIILIIIGFWKLKNQNSIILIFIIELYYYFCMGKYQKFLI
jgi:hypothetical protein